MIRLDNQDCALRLSARCVMLPKIEYLSTARRQCLEPVERLFSSHGIYLDLESGFEPLLEDSKSSVLPLDDSRIKTMRA